jgi:hypothetical protein
MSASVRHIPVGVVVERRKATSPWAEFLWRPVAVLAGLPDAAAWTPLAEEGERPSFVKRRRDRADPEALAYRAPQTGRRDERR